MQKQSHTASDGSSIQSFLNISACSYEGSLFGFSVDESQEDIGLELRMTYGFHSSRGSLKALSCSSSGRYLVSGGMDERIKIFDMRKHSAVGELTNHTGAITCLSFFQDAYLFSGSEDCNICIWRVYDWQCVHILGGHKGSIVDFSIHPTGMLALSISKDSTLKLWNLVQGRCSFTRKLKQLAEQVSWHATGDYYMLVFSKSIQVYQAADNSCVGTCAMDSRINRACFSLSSAIDREKASVSDSTSAPAPKDEEDVLASQGYRIAAVCDDKSLHLFDLHGSEVGGCSLSSLGVGRPRSLWSASGHSDAIQDADVGDLLRTAGDCLVVATSTGQVIVLSTSMLEQQGSLEGANAALLSTYQIKAEPRLTSIIAWNPSNTGTVISNKKHLSMYDYDVSTDEEAEPQPPVEMEIANGHGHGMGNKRERGEGGEQQKTKKMKKKKIRQA